LRILTSLASLLRAFCRKSRISVICFGIVYKNLWRRGTELKVRDFSTKFIVDELSGPPNFNLQSGAPLQGPCASYLGCRGAISASTGFHHPPSYLQLGLASSRCFVADIHSEIKRDMNRGPVEKVLAEHKKVVLQKMK
jgi:hypothetical protein